ncbi:MAG TPA: MerR family transcriptional regulator [bacterium]|nr:MerR family transcriptional regulator [bacterium]
MGNFYQIGEVCQATGLTPRTLHYYDEIGLLVPSERLAGGQRLYTAADLQRIEEIKELKRLLGLSLSEIKRLLDAEEARRRHLAAANEAPDEPARRAALEQALGVAEAQARSVQDKIHQLTEFGRKLDRHVRDLRRLLRNGNGAAVRQEAARPAAGPAKTALKTASVAQGSAATRAGGER